MTEEEPNKELVDALLQDVAGLRQERERLWRGDLDRQKKINEEIERIRVQIDVLLTG